MGARKQARRPVVAETTIPLRVEQLKSFEREAKKLRSEADLNELRQAAAQFRELGTVIRDTGGLRKLRWALDNNKGKSGGARVLYYYGGDHMPLYLVAIYPKSSKETMTKEEKKAARKLIKALKDAHAANKRAKLKVIK